MRALTLIQPWAWCITHSDKRVENRTWAPPDSLLGQRFAIHAGKHPPDLEVIYGLRGEGVIVPPGLVLGAVVGTARLLGVVHASGVLEVAPELESLRARAFLVGRRARWWIGPIGWVLDDVRALAEPVPCRGAQGLWTLPSDVETRVRAQESAS